MVIGLLGSEIDAPPDANQRWNEHPGPMAPSEYSPGKRPARVVFAPKVLLRKYAEQPPEAPTVRLKVDPPHDGTEAFVGG